MKDTILIISANPYSIKNEVTGEIENEGISINYCMTGDVLPQAEENGFMGYQVMKSSLPKNQLKEFTSVPAFYDCDFTVKPDSKTKAATLKPNAVKFKKALV